MDLSAHSKVILLYVSDQNRLLREIDALGNSRERLEGKIKKDAVEEITGVGSQTRKNWISGKAISIDKQMALFAATIKFINDHAKYNPKVAPGLIERVMQFRDLVATTEDELDVYEAARILGVSARECQRLVDEIVHTAYPLLRTVYYPASSSAWDIAASDLEQFAGTYAARVRRGKTWLQATLQVRYLHVTPRGSRFIRTKMNFPMLDRSRHNIDEGDPQQHFEYDGFMVPRASRIYFTFEQRQRSRGDFFQFITNRPSPDQDEHPVLAGRYLTTGQDNRWSIITGPILLRRQGLERNDPFQGRDFMLAQNRVLTEPAEIADAEADLVRSGLLDRDMETGEELAHDE